jgi:hypothetical protein
LLEAQAPITWPPPLISKVQADQLLEIICNDNNDSSVRVGGEVSLQGRPVLIPFGRCAFFEGELQPNKIVVPKKNAEGEDVETTMESPAGATSTNLHPPPHQAVTEQEEVYIAVPTTIRAGKADATTTTTTTTDSTTTDPLPVPLSEAIRWLKDHSSSIDSKPMAKGGNKPPPTEPKKTSTTPSKVRTTSSHNNTSVASPADAAFPLVDIQEEYTEDGRQVYGKAVDITSKLKELWKTDDRHSRGGEEKHPYDYDDDNDDHTNLDVDESVAHNVLNDMIGESSSPKSSPSRSSARPTVSDEEYDRLSKRLEELARLEEEEQQRQPRTSSLQQSTKNNYAVKNKKSTSLQFQRGFLNAKPKPAKKTALKEEAVTKKSKITIDTTKNTIQEIPKVGRQQPVPPKQPLFQPHSSAPVMMDAGNVFSGVIQERAASGNPSAAAAKPTAATTSTASMNNNINDAGKKKRVSRFAQERRQQQ